MAEPISFTIILGIGYKVAVVLGVGSALTAGAIRLWGSTRAWRWQTIHGCRRSTVLFNNYLPPTQKFNMKRSLARLVASHNVDCVKRRMSWRNTAGETETHMVPTSNFTISLGNLKLFVHPIIGANRELLGYDFWTQCWFHRNSRKRETQMNQAIDQFLQTGNGLTQRFD